ncbi:MAG: hypothetical protein HDKAJFGB_02197 [Anaerolineae bacterium]|nr:hypothetical protein [Anaerolineae bacterium]
MFCKIVVWAGALCALLALAGSAAAQQDIAAQTLTRINQARADAGLPSLTLNAQLNAAAQDHANDLQNNGVSLGHRGSDGSTIKQRIARAGYGGGTTGENWAAYRTFDQIMDFWLNDPPHRRNILHQKFREIGIGVALRANGGLIIVTDFGAPDNAPELAIATAAPTKAPRQARVAPTKAKPATSKPTRAPTRQPTPHATRVRTQAAPPAPTLAPQPEPTRLALAAAPPPQLKLAAPLRARGRVAQGIVRGSASALVNAPPDADASSRMALGAIMAVSGALGLGLAMAGHWRFRNR